MLYLILLLPLAMAALSLIRNDRVRTVILSVGQALLLALLIAACTLGDTCSPAFLAQPCGWTAWAGSSVC